MSNVDWKVVRAACVRYRVLLENDVDDYTMNQVTDEINEMFSFADLIDLIDLGLHQQQKDLHGV